MGIVKIKVFYGLDYSRCKNINIERKVFTNMNFVLFSNKITETISQESSSMRIQYKDDEQTFVTMANDEDFEDALRCVEPITNFEDVFRLSVRVDDSLTPKYPEKKRQRINTTCPTSAEREKQITIPKSLDSASKRRLDFRTMESTSSKHEVKHTQEVEPCDTPLQRYISCCQAKIDAKLEEKYKLIDEKETINSQLNDVKDLNAGTGSLCHNCHLRLKHTARNCTFERCETLFSCGQEKLHPRELARHRQLDQSIQKIEKEIQQLSAEMENRKASVEKVQNSLSNRIEQELLTVDEHTYQENGHRNWQRLRKHVYAIQAYCKKHLNGKLPPKHELKTVLSVALDEVPELHKKNSLSQSKHGKKTPRENPFKTVLEDKGILFPSESSSSNSENDTPRYMPTNKEEEEEQLRIALLASANTGNKAHSKPLPVGAFNYQLESYNTHMPTQNLVPPPYYPVTQVHYPTQRNCFEEYVAPSNVNYYNTQPGYYMANTTPGSFAPYQLSSCTITTQHQDIHQGNSSHTGNSEENADITEDTTNDAANILLQLASKNSK